MEVEWLADWLKYAVQIVLANVKRHKVLHYVLEVNFPAGWIDKLGLKVGYLNKLKLQWIWLILNECDSSLLPGVKYQWVVECINQCLLWNQKETIPELYGW